MNIVLYQPDIALNLGATIRLCACLDIELHIIEPCGFPFNPKKIKQSALDYIDKIELIRHNSWQDFLKYKESHLGKLILFSTKASKNYYQIEYKKNDFLLFGSESKGVPADIWSDIDGSVTIPISKNTRSLNLVTSISLALGYAISQI